MWKKQNDPEGAQPESPSRQQHDAVKLLGDVLSQSPPNDSEKGKVTVASGKALGEDPNQVTNSATMNAYKDAVREFTTNATAFIEHLSLLTKARAAYEKAMRASTEMRRVLDSSDDNLRTLMTQLEQQVSVRDLDPATEKKPPETAKLERMKATEEGRAFRWP